MIEFYCYLDPAAGSLSFQILLGAAFALIAGFRSRIGRILCFFRRSKG